MGYNDNYLINQAAKQAGLNGGVMEGQSASIQPQYYAHRDLLDDGLNGARAALNLNGVASGAFGRLGATNYGQLGLGIDQSIQNLRDLASGKNSVAMQQLQQGLQQNLAAQRSMASSASPANAAMAARNAAMNMGRLGYGLSGQQAVAGQAERNAATQALGQLQLGAQQNAVNAANVGFNASNGAYGTMMGNPPITLGSLLQKGISAAGSALAS